MANPYRPYPVRITEIINETPDKQTRSFKLRFVNPDDRTRFVYEAGQFAQISLAGRGEIPIDIASSPTEKGDLLFSVHRAGHVTSHLHRLRRGDHLGLRGPYGKAFPWEEMKGKSVVVVGGGFAFTTLRAGITYMLAEENRSDFSDIRVIYGCRSPNGLLYMRDLRDWRKRGDIAVHLTVDDPGNTSWQDHIGLVPQIVERVVPPHGHDAYAIVCGPQVMIKFTVMALRGLGYSPQRIILSLENRMKCGIGLCGRCNIGKDYVCKEGPVFTVAQLGDMPDDF